MLSWLTLCISSTNNVKCKTFESALQVPGQAHSFIEHIQEGIAQAEADEAALLLFSGGQTRKAAGPRSEAEGYWLVAEAAGWWGHAGVRDRAFTEVRHPAHTCRLENFTLTDRHLSR